MADVKKNLYQRLLAITEEIGKIEKTGTNSSQGYKFIEQSMVVAEVRVQLAKHGVMIIPETVERTIDRYTKMVPDKYKPNDPAKEQATIHANVESRYTLVNADDPTDRIVCVWDAGEALDTSDKATNKATTASHKYFLMKLFNISDKDDPDQDSPEASTGAKAAYKPKAEVQIGERVDAAHPDLPPVESYDESIPLDRQVQFMATQAERIHALTITKLGNALKLKGIEDQNMRRDILDKLALEEYQAKSFQDMDEGQALELISRLSKPSTTKEELLGLVEPF